MKNITSIVFLLLINSALNAQLDNIQYQWPVPPLNTTQPLTATFSEFRNTLSSDHFHNAVDIAEPDGNPVYPCLDGIVHSIVSDEGSNSYVVVRTQFGNQWKKITYLHIVPNPSLVLGQSVTKGVSVIGTIYPGQGHTHLIERALVYSPSDYSVEINNVRENGGLDPFIDIYPPAIDPGSIQFRLNGTNTLVPANGLSSKIEIVVKVEERNGTSASHRNNGTYLLGFRIWDTDTANIVFEPADQGVKYKFDTKPSNTYVGRVFVQGTATLSNPVYFLTNGSGESYINQTGTVIDNYLDTEQIDVGEYLLEIFTEDTRHNTDQKFFPITITRNDVVAPETPVLTAVLNTDGKTGLHVKWLPNQDQDLAGYRLYYTGNTQLLNWSIAADETLLTKDMTSYEVSSPNEFLNPASGNVYFFYLTAVDTSGNESKISDIYSRSSYFDGTPYPKAIIVDGFDRFGGSASWQLPTHDFNTTYFKVMTVTDSIVISSCANDAVINSSVDLNDYDMVIWFVGDESTVYETLSAMEQLRLSQYLEAGGSLFISGSEIGWDLDRSHSTTSPTDTLFYRHYLKARFVYDGTSSMNQVIGAPSTVFEGMTINIGQIYPEDYPDDIDPVNGSIEMLHYNIMRNASTHRKAGVAYTGTFGQGTDIGKVIYFSFPFETIASYQHQTALMSGILDYFSIVSSVEDGKDLRSRLDYALSQNYPNPFNPSTTINIYLPVTAEVDLKIYDVLGREVYTFYNNEILPAGEHKLVWHAGDFASGVYFLRMKTGDFSSTKSMVLLK